MLEVVIDCSAVDSEADLWEAYVAAVMPEGATYFGRNLDAFRDALTGGPGWPGDRIVRFVSTARLRLREGNFYAALKEICETAPCVTVE